MITMTLPGGGCLMSNTGTYRVIDGKVVKVSDRVPGLAYTFDCFVPNGGYNSENLGCFIDSRRKKREVMRVQGVREAGDGSAGHIDSEVRKRYPKRLR